MFYIHLSLLLLLSCFSILTAAQKCSTHTSKYFIPNDTTVSYLDASHTCIEYGGALVDVNNDNYNEIRQVMDTCFPEGIQVWIRSFASPNNTPKCIRIPSGPGLIKEPITFNCNDKTYPICTQKQ